MNDDELRAAVRTVERNSWRLDALDKARDKIEARVAVLESLVNDLRFTDAVAQALAEKLDERHSFQLTILQKVGAGVFALVLVCLPVAIEKLT